MEPFQQIRVPSALYRRLAERAEAEGFSSPDAYAVHLLSELLEGAEEESLSEQEREQVKERLRALGYLD